MLNAFDNRDVCDSLVNFRQILVIFSSVTFWSHFCHPFLICMSSKRLTDTHITGQVVKSSSKQKIFGGQKMILFY